MFSFVRVAQAFTYLMLNAVKGGKSMDSRQKLSNAQAKVQKLLSGSAGDNENKPLEQKAVNIRTQIKALLGRMEG